MSATPDNRGVRWQPVFWGAVAVTALMTYAGIAVFRIHLYLSWLSGAAVATGFLFGFDKLAAIWNWRRVPEKTLLLLVLVGGFAGGWLGQFLFRHKTRKWTFWLVLGLSTCLHGVVTWFIWQHTGF